jgi:hypothetical protein
VPVGTRLSSPNAARLGYLVAIVVGAAFAAHAVRFPYLDGDLFWQARLGAYVAQHLALPHALGNETFGAPGAPWTAQEWAFSLAVWGATQHGALWALAVAAGAAAALALALAARRASAMGASALSIAVCACCAAICIQGSFGIRAQVFAWPLLAALAWALDLDGLATFCALPLIALWANVHASALLAIPLTAIDAVAHAFRGGLRNAETLRRALVAVGAPLAVLATPLGWHLPAYAIALERSPIRHAIDEWQPLSLRHDFFWLGGAPLLVLVLAFARTLWRERPRDVVWTLLLAAMTFDAIRNAALFAPIAAPLAARALDLALARTPWWRRDPLQGVRFRRIAMVATAGLATAAFTVGLRAPLSMAHWTPPRATITALAAIPGEHRLFCYDFTVCSIALNYANLRVFMDGRADPYPLPVWNNFDRIRFARPGWLQRANAYGIDAVIAKTGGPLDRALRSLRGWNALPSRDACCRMYVRSR